MGKEIPFSRKHSQFFLGSRASKIFTNKTSKMSKHFYLLTLLVLGAFASALEDSMDLSSANVNNSDNNFTTAENSTLPWNNSQISLKPIKVETELYVVDPPEVVLPVEPELDPETEVEVHFTLSGGFHSRPVPHLNDSNSNETDEGLVNLFLSPSPEELILKELQTLADENKENSTDNDSDQDFQDPATEKPFDDLDLSLAHLLSEHDFVVFGPIILAPRHAPKKSILTEIAERPCQGCSRNYMPGFQRWAMPGRNSDTSSSKKRSNPDHEHFGNFEADDVDLFRRNILSRRLHALRSTKMVPELRPFVPKVNFVHKIPTQNLNSNQIVGPPVPPEDNSRSLFSWNWWPWSKSASTPTSLGPATTVPTPTTTEISEDDIIILPPKVKANPVRKPSILIPSVTAAAARPPIETKPTKLIPNAKSPIPIPANSAPVRSAQPARLYPNQFRLKKSVDSPSRNNFNQVKNCSPGTPGCDLRPREILPPAPAAPQTQNVPTGFVPPHYQQGQQINCPFLQKFRR